MQIFVIIYIHNDTMRGYARCHTIDWRLGAGGGLLDVPQRYKTSFHRQTFEPLQPHLSQTACCAMAVLLSFRKVLTLHQTACQFDKSIPNC